MRLDDSIAQRGRLNSIIYFGSTMRLKHLHLIFGILTVVFFLWTGQYLKQGFPELYGDDAFVRSQYRANHIYILLAGLIHIALSLNLSLDSIRWKRGLQQLGSALIFLATFLLGFAFFEESAAPTDERAITQKCMFLLLGGTLVHVPFAKWKTSSREATKPAP